jgi:translation initiation factor 3 subunit M
VKKDECVRKMRLLSLCTLASSKAEMKYSEIAACMQISEAEVEAWVIKAITAKLLDAKMDQINKTVVVKCVAPFYSPAFHFFISMSPAVSLPSSV